MEDLNDKINDGGATADGQLGADEWNQIPSEIQNVIENTGQALSGADLNQLGKGIADYVGNGDFYTDGGAADAYVLTQIGLKQAPTAYKDGLSAIFRATNTNTGASTVNVAGLGVKNIKTVAGADPAAGDITAGDLIELRYDLANGWFDFISTAVADASTTVKGIVELLTNAELAAGTDTTRAATAAAIASLFGASSQATSGYARIPIKIGGAIDEIIIQWGEGTFSSGVDAVVFPIAFPNAAFQVASIHGSSASAGANTYAVGTQSGTLTTTGVTLNASNNATSGSHRYIAIGH